MKSRSDLVNKRQKWRSPSSASDEYASNPELQLRRFGERVLETENNFLERELERLKQLALQRKSGRAESDAALDQSGDSSPLADSVGRRSRNISFSTGQRSEHRASSSSSGEVNKERSQSLSSTRSKRFRTGSGASAGSITSGSGNNFEGESFTGLCYCINALTSPSFSRREHDEQQCARQLALTTAGS